MQHSSSFGESFEESLKRKLKISEFPELNCFWGMSIKVDSTGIRINQRKYINTVLDEYNMVDCKRVGTPGPENERLS